MNDPRAAEGAMILDMLEHAKGLIATNLEGKTTVINGNKLLNNEINEKWEKTGKHANDE